LTATIYSGNSSLIHSDFSYDFYAGPNAGNLTPTSYGRNTGIGYAALEAVTIGEENTAIGVYALMLNTNGSENTANGCFALANNLSGMENTANGDGALLNNTTGTGNTACGFGALVVNTTGSFNIALGREAGSQISTGINNIDVGNAGVSGESGVIRIGDTNYQTATYLAGNVFASGNLTANSLLVTSDRAAKENFVRINSREVLEKVASLPITEWNYKAESGAVQHIGPVAQDFHAAFQLSTDDKHISVADEGGVALAAIQGLNEKLETDNAALRQQNQVLANRLDELEATVRQLVIPK